jgi:ribosomal protein L7/L12
MDFDIFFNLFGLPWPFDITIKKREDNLVLSAINCSNGSKILAIKTLRMNWPEYLSLREAKTMIEKAW